jgi:hypothetical protein
MYYLNKSQLAQKILKAVFISIIVVTLLVCAGCDFMSEPPDIIPCIIIDINVITPSVIEISWVEYNLQVEEYTIIKSIQDSVLATYVFSSNENSFIDEQIIPGVNYIYKIYINDDDYLWDFASINTLQPPSGLRVIVSNGEAIRLGWQDNNQIEDFYYVERKEENENNFTIIDSLPTNSECYLDYDLEHMKRYYYRLNAKIDDYFTEYTNIASTGFHFEGLFVPTDYTTIEQAFEAASPAEKVILEPGSYNGGIIFPSKSITLCSRFALDNNPSHIENTIIDGGNQTITGIRFPPETTIYSPQGKVQGLTIQNCNNGAIKGLDNTSPTLCNLIIKDNITGSYGAIYFQNCTNVNIRNLLIYDNSSSIHGSAINLSNSFIRIYNCTIANNDGDAIYCMNYSGIGVYNTIIYSNNGNAIYLYVSCWSCTIFYSDIESGEDGILNSSSIDPWWFHSINSDPLFVDIENNDYHLQPDSPCVDAGEDLEIYLDVDGTRNDIGAYGGPDGNW